MLSNSGNRQQTLTIKQAGDFAIRLHMMGRPSDAESICQQILKADPNYPDALHLLGVIAHSEGNSDDAVSLITQVLALTPRNADAHNNLGEALRHLERLDEAEAAYRRALELNPNSAEAHSNLGNALRELDRTDEAEASYRRALSLKPNADKIHTNLGILLRERGDFVAAEESFRRAVEINPRHTAAHEHLSRFHRAAPGDPLIGTLRDVLNAPDLSADEKRYANFALAKYFFDIGEDNAAFSHLEDAHRARAAALGHEYHPALDQRQLREMCDLFPREFFRARRAAPLHSTPKPIFVVGMPRSGTSLVEQILATHSAVAGAGELPTLRRLAEELGDLAGAAPHLTEDRCETLRARYLSHLRKIAPNSPMVVDKMPHNFETLWLAARLFPEAPIIHCARDPLDTCLSCYVTDFTVGHSYTDDLQSLGKHYRYYQALMAHWEAVLPRKPLRLAYEDLVADPETAIKAMLAYCGLSFEDDCEMFYRTERPIRTASAQQVRKPIYTSSVGRWKRYTKYIQPLVAELE